ncbi:FAD-binding oxidoreductase [Plantactinospora siamensis]|uniref:FAD-binding oxidoreductase n=1 Tax=Plantactinospora siamensis TaxID=555372 RepID=A0ABV6NU37_9ACTN
MAGAGEVTGRAAPGRAGPRVDGVPGVRPAGAADVVAGVPARYVAEPADTGEASAVLRAAGATGAAVAFRGGGSTLDWGNPPERLDLLVDTRRLAGVVEHAAGDLITVVRAGTRLADLAELLSGAGQQLALDVPGSAATVGGTVAAGRSGPRRMLYGTVRDLLIGVTVVRADGVVAHAGGKVVKNVAGYDLGKLVTGSHGTLGLITECAFRLHPLPAATAYVSRGLADPVEAAELAAAVRGAQLVPSALELDVPGGGGARLCVLLEGTPAGVAARAAAAVRLLGPDAVAAPEPPDWWAAPPWRPGEVGLKLTAALSGVPGLLAAARAATDRHGLPVAVRGSAGVGVLYAGLPADDPAAVAGVVIELRAACLAAGGHGVVLTAPAAVRDLVDLWGPVDGLDLMRRVKQRLDPDRLLAPGRFVGGI